MRGIASEALLTVGVLIAIGISLIQLKGVFYGQQKVAKEEVAYAFAEDLRNIIDEARAATGDVRFEYHPSIKEYVVRIVGNRIIVHDKVSKVNATLVVSGIKLKENIFEDSPVVYIVKRNDRFYILGKCKEVGERCYSSLSCCSGYCWGEPLVCQEKCAKLGEKAADDEACCSGFLNKTTGRCAEPPLCPKERVCPGAPEANKVDGVDCCPGGYVCSDGHCCPEDKPRWCENPKSGSPRCMDENEFKGECIRYKRYHIVFVPLYYGQNEFSLFKRDAERAFEKWLSFSPFRECKNPKSRVEAHFIDPKNCQGTCSSICGDCQTLILNCVLNSKYRNIWNKIVGICKDFSCPNANLCGCAAGIPSDTSISKNGCEGKHTVSHEMGHSFGLCHVDTCGALGACLSWCPNRADCKEQDKTYYLMGYCPWRNKYGPAAYSFLKNFVFKEYLVGC